MKTYCMTQKDLHLPGICKDAEVAPDEGTLRNAATHRHQLPGNRKIFRDQLKETEIGLDQISGYLDYPVLFRQISVGFD